MGVCARVACGQTIGSRLLRRLGAERPTAQHGRTVNKDNTAAGASTNRMAAEWPCMSPGRVADLLALPHAHRLRRLRSLGSTSCGRWWAAPCEASFSRYPAPSTSTAEPKTTPRCVARSPPGSRLPASRILRVLLQSPLAETSLPHDSTSTRGLLLLWQIAASRFTSLARAAPISLAKADSLGVWDESATSTSHHTHSLSFTPVALWPLVRA